MSLRTLVPNTSVKYGAWAKIETPAIARVILFNMVMPSPGLCISYVVSLADRAYQQKRARGEKIDSRCYSC